jgi:parallel beta-helix repeat protein
VIGSGAGGPGTGIELRGTDHVNVVGNTISDCWGPGIELRNLTSRCVIANNVLTDVCQRVNKAGIELIGPETGLPPGAHGATSNLLRGLTIGSISGQDFGPILAWYNCSFHDVCDDVGCAA